MKNTQFAAILTAAILLTGCSSNTVQSDPGMASRESEAKSHITEQADPASTEETASDTAVTSEAQKISEMLGLKDYKAPWSREDYPELDISKIPAKGEGTVRMTIGAYALDDVCVWLLADDAYTDSGRIFCTSMHIGLSVSGVEQDIIAAPQTLAAPDGTFECDPEKLQEQVGYTSMPHTYYGINSFSDESDSGCEYYEVRWNDETGHYTLTSMGSTAERCSLSGNGLTLPPEQLSGEYMLSDCPAVVSCDGALSQNEALEILSGKFLDSLTADDDNVLEYRNVTAEILGRTMEAPADEAGYPQSPWDSLETWEMNWDAWLVNISAELRREEAADEAGQWIGLTAGKGSERGYLMYNDGASWYLWSRNAYSMLPDILR